MSFFVLFQGSDRVVHPDNDQPIEMRLSTYAAYAERGPLLERGF